MSALDSAGRGERAAAAPLRPPVPVAPFPRSAGAASAPAGLVLALGAFGVGHWLRTALDGTARPLADGMAFWAAATCSAAWTPVPRHAEPAQ